MYILWMYMYTTRRIMSLLAHRRKLRAISQRVWVPLQWAPRDPIVQWAPRAWKDPIVQARLRARRAIVQARLRDHLLDGLLEETWVLRRR